MSYILDALQRADAERERERGQVPGLHSRATPLNMAAPARRGRRWWLPAAVVVLGGLGLILVWRFWPPVAGPVLPEASVAEAQPTAAAPAAEPSITEAALPSPDPALPILGPRLPPAPTPSVPPTAGVGSGASDPTPAGASASTPTRAVTAPASTPTASSPRAADRVPSFGELAPDVRSRLPQVSVNGATYSANPEHRMLIINGQVLQEGQDIQPGLRLESIGPRSAVLVHQGMRYSIGY
jgi:general secretion pathway protein B